MWQARQASNLQPPDSESGALPIELRAPLLDTPAGLEPAWSGLEGRRLDPFSHGVGPRHDIRATPASLPAGRAQVS